MSHATRRKRIYEVARGDQDYPLCNIPGCGLPVVPGERWVESHMPIAKTFEGRAVGVAHFRCNAVHGAEVVTPVAAKMKRQRDKHRGIKGPGFGSHPLPCGHASKLKKQICGRVIDRISQRDMLRRTLAMRRIGG